MKDLSLLIEKYIGIKYSNTKTIAVYKNPTILDIRSLKDEHVNFIRFFVDVKNDDLYVWEGDRYLHHEIWNYLGLRPRAEEYEYYTKPRMIAGMGDLKGNKIVASELMYDKKHYKEVPTLSFRNLDMSEVQYRTALYGEEWNVK